MESIPLPQQGVQMAGQNAVPIQPGQPGQPGQPMGAPRQLTPQQMQQIQQQFQAEAARQGLTPQQLAEKLRAQAMAQQQQQQQQAAKGGAPAQQPPQQQRPAQVQQGGHVPIQPGPPKPEALAVAKFLRSQELKSRPCILQEKRREMFKVKRALRALQSPAYEKARKKDKLLPAVTDRVTAENTFKMLPISMLALRVSRVPPEAPTGKKPVKKKGQPWVVKIEQQQDASDPYHYVWFYEGSQWKQKLYAVGALLAVVAVVLFPLWPMKLRLGVWYLSMGALGLLGAFFGLAIVRLIFFIFSVMAIPPGIWIYPNLFEDVGFFDSFKPSWAWRETPESLKAKKAEKKAKRAAKREKQQNGKTGTTKTATSDAKPAVTAAAPTATASTGSAAPTDTKASTSGASLESGGAVSQRRVLSASVEDAADDDEDAN